MVEKNKKMILKYYELVDSERFEDLFELFSEDIIYMRAGKAIKGINELRDFYLLERSLRGKHILDEVHETDNGIVVKGTFSGTSSTGRLEVGFVDFFYFRDSKVFKRETYLSKGAELIS